MKSSFPIPDHPDVQCDIKTNHFSEGKPVFYQHDDYRIHMKLVVNFQGVMINRVSSMVFVVFCSIPHA